MAKWVWTCLVCKEKALVKSRKDGSGWHVRHRERTGHDISSTMSELLPRKRNGKRKEGRQ